MKILIVDDEQVALSSIQRLLKRRGLRDVEICGDGEEAIRRIREKDYDLVLLDFLMPGVDGLEVLKRSKPFKPETEFIMITAVDDLDSAVRAVRLGAYDYLVKPVDPERLMLSVEHAYERKGLLAGLVVKGSWDGTVEIPEAFSEIITGCPRMKALISYSRIMAQGGNPVLITGESGTGKELLARGIHRAGLTPDGPFVAVNVSSVPESLFESQFFGHVKGAFTGADRDHPGFFEQADGGTLFLDEIGELPLNLQVKFLRVLEEGRLVRLGETRPVSVNFRVVSATNRDLDAACQEGKFRLDLMYRLNSARIHLPPLREREGDIPLLATHYLRGAASRHGKDVQGFTPAALEILSCRTYPGNIRELAQVVENAVLLADSDLISPCHLGEGQPSGLSFARTLCTLRENDETHVVYVLKQAGGDKREAAEILGVSIRQVQRKLAQMRKDPSWREVIDHL